MRYYIYKNSKGDIIGYLQSETPVEGGAIEVTKEEFIELGFYSGEPSYNEPDPEPAPPTPTADERLDALEAAIAKGLAL